MSESSKLTEVIESLPEELRPIAAKYGPAFVGMSGAEVLAWVELLVSGQTREAWDVVVSRLSNGELLGKWTALNEEWKEANLENAQKLALVREATSALMRVLLTIALALVGL